ncbi:hypothetical protein BGX24_003418, partial [Mortierella sp. AD032]
MGKPSTPIYTRTRSSASAVKQQSSLNPKVLGSAAAAHGKGRTALNKRRRFVSDDVHNNNANVVIVPDSTPDVLNDITYFEDAYAHLRVFKPRVPTVVPHPNANSKGEWASIKGLFQNQVAATTSTQDQEQEQEQEQDLDKDYGFNDDNDFTDALNDLVTNGNFDDVVATAIHDAYQNGTINSDRPPIDGTSSITLGKRRRMIVEEETDEESEAAPSSTAITTIITSTSGTSANANASSSTVPAS